LKNSPEPQQMVVEATSQRTRQRTAEDVPGCIKLIILAFLIALLAAEGVYGYFFTPQRQDTTVLAASSNGFAGQNWLYWLLVALTLLLIALIVYLMRVQRVLKCQITSPAKDECAEATMAPPGAYYLIVTGTASGTVFGHYELTLTRTGSAVALPVITYPLAGNSTPVNAGPLGLIDATTLGDGKYTITLKVYPAGAGSFVSCSHDFWILKVAVYMQQVDGAVLDPPNDFYNPNAELVDGVPRRVAVGAWSIEILGAAYIYGCDNREIKDYEIRYARVAKPADEPALPASNTPAIPAPWNGPTSGSIVKLDYSAPVPLGAPSRYDPDTRVGWAETNLIRSFYLETITLTPFPWLPPITFQWWTLPWGSWDSRSVGADYATQSGRFALLLYAEDTSTTTHTYYNMRRVWLDNWPVVAHITGFQIPDGTLPDGTTSWKDLPPCADILISYKTLRIKGIAWDALCDKAYAAALAGGTLPSPLPTPITDAPNDNFAGYSMTFRKEFIGTPVAISVVNPLKRVPNALDFVPGPLPAVTDADVLADWDLTALDAGPSPTPGTCPLPSDPNRLYRGCACTYVVRVDASDTTLVPYGSGHHDAWEEQPIKIVNDM
jgi:hypothetical protein